ncbi:hypothetical protein M422DRAFT_52238 [Sphaerobolus stellatus SS14]|uniref:Uncharacterized protein n=1 Tax=Sphaerobolus stellatus (strain SS14) TaxID=990650 RepID=A0A0C9TUD0_SPHS4|nr:hypothetical protein M422DRAFT_52238 [Sphaerobolus stellatus SS14]
MYYHLIVCRLPLNYDGLTSGWRGMVLPIPSPTNIELIIWNAVRHHIFYTKLLLYAGLVWCGLFSYCAFSHGNIFLAVIIMALTFTQLGMSPYFRCSGRSYTRTLSATGLATTIKSAIIDDLWAVSDKFVGLLQGAASAATIIADCLISGSPVYFLKGPAMHISIMSILPVVMYFTTPSRLFIWEPFFIPAGQIRFLRYMTCLHQLTSNLSLNLRRTIREEIATRVRGQFSSGHRSSRYQDYSLPVPPHPNAYDIDAPSSPKTHNESIPLTRRGAPQIGAQDR